MTITIRFTKNNKLLQIKQNKKTAQLRAVKLDLV